LIANNAALMCKKTQQVNIFRAHKYEYELNTKSCHAFIKNNRK